MSALISFQIGSTHTEEELGRTLIQIAAMLCGVLLPVFIGQLLK